MVRKRREGHERFGEDSRAYILFAIKETTLHDLAATRVVLNVVVRIKSLFEVGGSFPDAVIDIELWDRIIVI